MGQVTVRNQVTQQQVSNGKWGREASPAVPYHSPSLVLPPEPLPSTPSVEELSFMKLVLSVKKVGDCSSRGYLHSLICGPFFHLQRRQVYIPLCIFFVERNFLAFKDLCDSIRPTQIIQDNLLTPASLNWSHQQKTLLLFILLATSGTVACHASLSPTILGVCPSLSLLKYPTAK